ncbi:DUF1178 family protein [Enterovirga rhinocerotis]|uniref:Uncharacterized protein n=1 Tax=Enterovirga rhinocerotis TaxID=1339210 RepID=A0A4R7CCW9_9HYPH|nr:DUF1178 family protein [Enterovirga rhinocerotis]TDR95036.1 hypothetical protein EV668_2328 [Enterovirga rhinocerotis]
MIRYSLVCEAGHEFETWFPSGSAYDDQKARGLLSCPVCDSRDVRKAIMAPSVATKSSLSAAAADPAPVEAAAQPVTLLSEKEQAFRAMLKAVREQVTKNADYVGTGFAEEARRMHHGEIEQRSIYGETSPVEARALIEEGIEVHPLPPAPDDRN